MGLLDDLAAAAMGGGGQGGPQAAPGGGGMGGGGMLGAILGAVQGHPGGLGGILGSLEQAGLGQQAGSWVGSGPNQPISPDQAQSALGGSLINDIAGRLGVPPGIASSAVAQYLPQIIDHLTPGGQVPQDGQGGLGGLGGLLGMLRR